MAQPARNLGRLSEIAQAAVKHGFGYMLDSSRSRRPRLRAAAGVDGDSPSDRGRHLREMLEELGPTFVKFGQLLSMRPDVLPPDVIAELRGLQDDVQAIPFDEVRQTVEADLGLTLERLFVEFEETPVAAASIGQVHRAVLPNGRSVVVKAQRPGAPQQIEADIALLYRAASLVKERVRALDFIDARALVDEFARSIRQELDYRREGRNAERFRRNFAGHPHVRIPRVYWSYSRSRVLTLELLEGTQLADVETLGYSLAERRRLAEILTEAWMTMIFRHGFFHADPHPANVIVLDPEHVGLVDFGQAGLLSDDDMTKGTRLFIDVANENVDALPRRLADLGVRYPKELEEQFRADLHDLYYRYYGASLAEVDPLGVIRETFALIHALNLRLPTRFVLLDKAIATLGLVTVELYPDFNVFEVAKPYARGLLAGRFTPRRLLARARRQSYDLSQIAAQLPYQVHDVLEELRDGEIQVNFMHRGLDMYTQRFAEAVNRLVIALVVAGGLIGSSLIGIFAEEGPQIFGLHAISVIGYLLSGVLGIWLLLGVIRSGRL
jgi:ubiquinone biosynthesis protein